MLLFRSLVIGLLGACLCLLVTRPRPRERVERVGPAREVVFRQASPAPPAATVTDVAAGITSEQLGSLVRLRPGEHVAAVADHPVTGDLDAGAVLATIPLHANEFVDLTIAGGCTGDRRVVLLLH